jgi:hypothetical protein
MQQMQVCVGVQQVEPYWYGLRLHFPGLLAVRWGMRRLGISRTTTSQSSPDVPCPRSIYRASRCVTRSRSPEIICVHTGTHRKGGWPQQSHEDRNNQLPRSCTRRIRPGQGSRWCTADHRDEASPGGTASTTNAPNCGTIVFVLGKDISQ